MDKNDQLHGMLYKVLNLLLYAVVTICNKAVLKHTGMGVEQLFFSSAFMGFISIALFLKFVKHRSLYQLTKGINLKYLFRTALSISGRCAFLYSMTVMDATVATAISYLRPIFALLIGVFLLSEEITWRMGIALVISIVGAALVTGPLVTMDHVNMFPILAAFLAPLAWALYDLLVKKQSEKDDWEKQVYLTYLLISVFSFPLALKGWQPIPTKMAFAFLLMGIMYVLIEMSLAKALKRISLVLIAPITFIRLIFTAILGYFFVAERINMATIVGCSLIVVATIIAFISIPSKKALIQPSLRDEETN